MPFLVALIGSMISIIIYFSFSRHNPILMSPIDYDDQVVLLNLKNYEADGFLKYNTFTNRKGHLRVGLYGGVDGCIYTEKNEVRASALNVSNEAVPLRALENDCVYMHYPHLSQIIHYLLYKVGIVDLDRISSFYLFNIFLSFIFVFILTFLIQEVTGNRLISLVTVGLYVTSISYFEFQFVLYHYCFQFIFLLVYFCLLWRKKYKNAMLLSLFSSFIGLDFFLGYFICNVYLCFFVAGERKLKAGVILLHCLLVAGYLYLIVSVLGWDRFSEDLIATLNHRTGGTNYISSLFEAFIRQAHTVFGKSFSIWSIVATFGMAIFVWKNVPSHKKKILCACFVFSVSLTFFTPNSAYYHAWYKYILFLIFLLPFHAIVWAQFASSKKKIIFSVFLLLVLSFNSLPRFIAKAKVVNTNFQYSREYGSKLDNIFDIFVYPQKKDTNEDKWQVYDLRKTILSPVPPWVSDKVLIPPPGESKEIGFAQGLNFLIKLKKDHNVSEVLLVIKDLDPQKLECTFYTYQQTEFQLVEKNWVIKKLSKEFSAMTLNLADYNKEVFKIKCDGSEKSKISRIWFN